MGRTVRNAKTDTRSARAKLAIQPEPYWTALSRGCFLGYRRNLKGGTWVARFRDLRKKQRYETLGAADDALDPDGLIVFSFSQAHQRAVAWFRQKAREDAGEPHDDDHGPYTVGRAVADYRKDYLRRGGKAVDRLDWSAAAWILPELGAFPIERLTKKRIENWHQKVAETPARLRTKAGATQKHREIDRGPEAVRRRRSTANRVLTILKAALNFAFSEGNCTTDDAWRPVRAFREADAARTRYLSDDEARRLTNACPPDFRTLVTVALLSGARYGELVAMTVDDFNPDAGTLRVRASKSGQSRHIVLTEEGRVFVAQRAAGKPGSARLLLRANGSPWAKSEQQRPLIAACERAKIDPVVRFHELRHFYASRCVMAGAPLAVVAAQLGHTSTRMVEKYYAHLAPSYISDVVRGVFAPMGLVDASNVTPIAGSR